MRLKDKIESILQSTFDVTRLNVEDESALHAGHAGAREGGESHFRVLVVSRDFEGKPMAARHRLVYQAVKEFMPNPIHALTVKAYTPGEYG